MKIEYKKGRRNPPPSFSKPPAPPAPPKAQPEIAALAKPVQFDPAEAPQKPVVKGE